MLLAATALAAQEPVRLPAVVVKSAPPAPGRNIMVGVVRDTSAIPIDSVEVTIPALKRRLLSAGNGEFRFDRIPPGEYEVRARKIGYTPQIRKFVVDDSGGTGAFELIPFAVGLQPVITTASRRGLAGVVGDTGFRAIARAEVRAAGHDLVTETDSLGAFYLPARPGRYLINVYRDGFADRMVSVTVPHDSGRFMRVTLLPEHDTPIQWRANVAELSSRQARRTFTNSAFFTRDDLIAMDIEWVFDAVRVGAQAPDIDHGCSVVKNGGPTPIYLDDLTVDDIEAVEIYRRGTFFDRVPPKPASRLVGKKGVAQSRPMVPIANYGPTGNANFGKRCPVVYVWTR